MRTRKLSSPTETVWVDKHMYDEAERVHYERAAEQLVAEQGNAEEQQQVGSGDLELSGENYVKDEQKQPKNSRKQKRSRRSPKGQASLTKQDCALNGLVLESVWFDKYLYEEAERSFQTKLAADMAEALGGGQPSAKVQSLEVSPGEMKRQSGRSVVNCPHNSTVACHHVVCGFWVNKISFDSAEAAFVERYGSLCPSRPLELPLGFVDFDLPSHRTPDEGYVTAAATPATPGRPVSHLIALQLPSGQPAEKTVNGKPHLSVLQELIAEVWLEKPLYDDAERSFYETPSAGISTPLLLCRSRKSETTKKNKKSGKNLTGDGKERMNEREVSLSKPVCGISPFNYFGHPDSERVWLNKFMCDEAESRYHAAGAHDLSSCWTNDRHLTTSQRPSHAVASAPTTQRFKSKKMAGEFALYDKVWFDKPKYDDAEKQYYEQLSGTAPASPGKNTHVSPCKKSPGSHCHKKARGSHGHEEDGASTILRDIARARENIQKSLAGLKTVIRDTPEAKPVHSPRQSLPCISAAAPAGPAGESSDLVTRLSNLELENQSLHRVVEDLQLAISKLEVRLTTLEKSPTSHPTPAAPLASAPTTNAQPAAPVKKVEVTAEAEDDDDDIDLFGSDEEDAEAERIREERLRQYAEKKSKKPALIAKSSILLDVKPWDDETDMAKLEECVRTVQMDGLLWGSSKLVPVGYGIRKLQIQCVVEDDKVGTDILEEEITKFEDYVQSVDIAAFNKI